MKAEEALVAVHRKVVRKSKVQDTCEILIESCEVVSEASGQLEQHHLPSRYRYQIWKDDRLSQANSRQLKQAQKEHQRGREKLSHVVVSHRECSP